MKIIATAGSRKLLCEVNRRELAQLSNNWELLSDSTSSLIGVEFQLEDRWRRMQKMEKARDELDQVIRQLREIADSLEPLGMTIQMPSLAEEEEKEPAGGD